MGGSHPPYYFMPRLLELAASSEFRDIDVVHSVGYYFFGTVFAHGVARSRRVPHISTPVYTLNPSTWQRRMFDRVAGRYLVRNVNHVIPQSEHELQFMRADRFDVKSSTIVPFGVDSSLFDRDHDVDDLRTRHAIARGDKVLLFVGKVMSPKGAFDCLEVVGRLRSAGRAVRLIMMGDVHDQGTRDIRCPHPPAWPGCGGRSAWRRHGSTRNLAILPALRSRALPVPIRTIRHRGHRGCRKRAAAARDARGHHADARAALPVRPPASVWRHRAFHAQRERGARRAALPGKCGRNRADILSQYDWRTISAAPNESTSRLWGRAVE